MTSPTAATLTAPTRGWRSRADRVTQPPEKPVLLQQTLEISEIPDSGLDQPSADGKYKSRNPDHIPSDLKGNYRNVSHTTHATQTGNYSQKLLVLQF